MTAVFGMSKTWGDLANVDPTGPKEKGMSEGVSRVAMEEARTRALNRKREARNAQLHAEAEIEATLRVASENQAFELRKMDDRAEQRFNALRDIRLTCETKLAREHQAQSQKMDQVAQNRKNAEEQRRRAEENHLDCERRIVGLTDAALKHSAQHDAEQAEVMDDAARQISDTQMKAQAQVDEAGRTIQSKIRDYEERRDMREANCLNSSFELETVGDGVKLLSEVERRRAKIAQLVAEADAASTRSMAAQMVTSANETSANALISARRFADQVRRQADTMVGQGLMLAAENIHNAQAECLQLTKVDLATELFVQDREIAKVGQKELQAKWESEKQVKKKRVEYQAVQAEAQAYKVNSQEELIARRQDADERVAALSGRLLQAQDACEQALENVSRLSADSYKSSRKRIEEENQRIVQELSRTMLRIKELETDADETVTRAQREAERKVRSLDARANQLLEKTQEAEEFSKSDAVERAARAEVRLLELRKRLHDEKQEEADKALDEMEAQAEEESQGLTVLLQTQVEEERGKAKELDQEGFYLGEEFKRADRRLREVLQGLRANGNPDIAEELRWLCWNPKARIERYPNGLAGYTFAQEEEGEEAVQKEDGSGIPNSEWTGERRTRSGWGELRSSAVPFVQWDEENEAGL